MSSDRQWLHATDAGWVLEFADGSSTASPPVAAPRVVAVSGLRVSVDGTDSFSVSSAITGYSWNFDDGSPPVATSTVTHTYPAAGTYSILLSVTDSGGQTASQTVTVTVDTSSVNQPPVAGFSTQVASNTVHVDGTASVDPDGFVTAWTWSFGDGKSGSGKSLDHSYTTAGSYPITLIVTDNQGAQSQLTKTVTVSGGSTGVNTPPTANFTATVLSTGVGDVDVNGSGSIDPDGSIASWGWNFGDGTTGSGSTTRHTYKSSGTYQIVLTVTDNDGATGQASRTVSVSLGTSSTQPKGTGIVAYQTLTGSKFSTRVNSAGTTNSVSFPTGTFSFSNFSDGSQTISSGASAYGAAITTKGLLGSGVGKSILQMVANTSNKAGDVPPSCAAGGGLTCPTNNLYLIRLIQAGAKFDGLTLQGTDQGHNYNGLRYENVASPTLSNASVLHIPGSGPGNPDETFHVNFQHATGTATITNVLIDGQGVGAAGIAMNSASAHFVINGLTTKGMAYSAGIATWQQTGPMDIHGWKHLDGPRAFGAERLAARVNFFDPQWGKPTSGHDITYTWETGYVGGSIYFNFSSAATVPTRKLVIRSRLKGVTGNINGSVHVLVAGVTKTTSDYVTFI